MAEATAEREDQDLEEEDDELDLDGEDTGDDPDDEEEDEDDPVETQVAARLTAELTELAREEGLEFDGEVTSRTQLNELRQARRDEAAREQTRTNVKNALANAGKNAANQLRGWKATAHDAEGNPVEVTLPADVLTQIEGMFGEDFADGLRELHESEFMGALASQATRLIPREKHDELNKALGKGATFEKWLKTVVEFAAPTSEWGRKAVSEGKKEGFKQGRNAPDGLPSQRNPRGGARTKSYVELEDGYGAGTLSDAEEREYLKQRAER